MADAQKPEKSMNNAAIKKRSSFTTAGYGYILYPSITMLGNGEWLAAFNHSRRHEPPLHPPEYPGFRTLL
ncbi:MAG TPA: hypothetical protein DIT01_05570 [Lentisphaeria bacterium]|nr:hypothetical protein [Lentisphaeria bacterium]|tara:strand:- start:1765 stop:1974 length:210 start_codon:yes stop_codon:yes gene_type:complete